MILESIKNLKYVKKSKGLFDNSKFVRFISKFLAVIFMFIPFYIYLFARFLILFIVFCFILGWIQILLIAGV